MRRDLLVEAVGGLGVLLVVGSWRAIRLAWEWSLAVLLKRRTPKCPTCRGTGKIPLVKFHWGSVAAETTTCCPSCDGSGEARDVR